MTETGLLKIDSYQKTGKVSWTTTGTLKKEKNKLPVPEFIINEFAGNEPALSNFNNLAPSFQRIYILWITSAKRDVTIRARLEEAIELLKENKKLGLK
jgi:uncharacterized protein YdeI (YjbR/CyaY-like superfamily)